MHKWHYVDMDSDDPLSWPTFGQIGNLRDLSHLGAIRKAKGDEAAEEAQHKLDPRGLLIEAVLDAFGFVVAPALTATPSGEPGLVVYCTCGKRWFSPLRDIYVLRQLSAAYFKISGKPMVTRTENTILDTLERFALLHGNYVQWTDDGKFSAYPVSDNTLSDRVNKP